MDGVAPDTLTADEAGEAVRLAQAELERAVREGNLTRDPMRLPLGALAITLGAQHRLHLATVEQMRSAASDLGQQLAAALKQAREPIDPDALARLEKAAATGADRRVAELANTHSWRNVLLAAAVLAVSVLGTGSVCYWRGYVDAEARVHETAAGLAEAFQNGPAAAAGWLNLMRNNNLPNALATCKGERSFTDQTGARACLVPLRTEPPKPDAPR